MEYVGGNALLMTNPAATEILLVPFHIAAECRQFEHLCLSMRSGSHFLGRLQMKKKYLRANQ